MGTKFAATELTCIAVKFVGGPPGLHYLISLGNPLRRGYIPMRGITTVIIVGKIDQILRREPCRSRAYPTVGPRFPQTGYGSERDFRCGKEPSGLSQRSKRAIKFFTGDRRLNRGNRRPSIFPVRRVIPWNRGRMWWVRGVPRHCQENRLLDPRIGVGCG
jgi:hypothetical protein